MFVQLLIMSIISIVVGIVELIIFALFFRKRIDVKYLIKIIILVNIMTNLVFFAILNYGYFFVFYHDFPILGFDIDGTSLLMIIEEIIIFIAECLMFKHAFNNYIKEKVISKKKLYIITFLANLITFVMEYILYWYYL